VSVLRNLESKLAGLVEGTFSRAFKSEVRPVEIARKLTREMEEHKVQSLSRIYVPNQYAVWLSPEDREQFAGYEDELRRELAGYLLEHARRERVALVSRPEVEFRTDERLRLCSAARASPTSCSTTPTSRASTPRCGLRAARGSCATSGRPTG
jgi:hypothetical protein